jgi:4'-phosphopantetheinyl transferase
MTTEAISEAPPLEGGVVGVWLVGPVTLDTLATVGDGCLDAGERDRAGRFHNRVDARRFVGRRVAVRFLAATYLGRRADEIAFDRTCQICGNESHGRPRLRNCDGATLHFGVSSAADSAAVVMSTRFEVAIDIEPVGLALPTDFIENCNVFTPAEQARFATLDHRCRSQLLLRWWTAKEAALKLAGYGLALAPSTIDVSALRATGGRVSFDGRSVALRSVSSAETGYVGSIATSAEPSRVDVIVQD